MARAWPWIATIVAAALGALGCDPALQSEGEPRPDVLRVEDQEIEPPVLPFTDVTMASGITWRHTNGARGDKMLPETLGSGAAFLDVDSDGDQDLILVNGRPWPEDHEQGPLPTQALYVNDGTGNFHEATGEWGLDVAFYGTGIAVADLEGDGDPDVLFTAVGEDRLFENRGDRFVEITERAGVAGPASDWSSGAVFFDADGDADLDLFVCTYLVWSREIDLEIDFTLDGLGRAYGPPKSYAGTQPRYYRNRGDGTFELATSEAGFEVFHPSTEEALGKGLDALTLDLGSDGDLDLFVANDTVRNFLFENDGAGRFTEVGVERGVAFDDNGAATGAMGIDAAWYDEKLTLAIAVGNYADEMSSFFVAEPDSDADFFSDWTVLEGLGPATRPQLSFGLLFADFDLDGWPDLVQTNGHLEEAIQVIQPNQRYRQASQLFWNGIGAGTRFILLEEGTVGDLATPIVGRSATTADIDADGDPDLLITQPGDRPILLRNDQDVGHHWLRLDLRDPEGHPDAIGAVIEVVAGGRTQRQHLVTSRSYLAVTERIATFGLGESSAADEIRVRWPGRTEFVVYPGPWPADRVHRVPPED